MHHIPFLTNCKVLRRAKQLEKLAFLVLSTNRVRSRSFETGWLEGLGARDAF